MTRAELARYAKAWRLRNGITQSQLAVAMGCMQSEVSRIETLDGGCSMDLFMEYIEAMGLELKIGVME